MRFVRRRAYGLPIWLRAPERISRSMVSRLQSRILVLLLALAFPSGQGRSVRYSSRAFLRSKMDRLRTSFRLRWDSDSSLTPRTFAATLANPRLVFRSFRQILAGDSVLVAIQSVGVVTDTARLGEKALRFRLRREVG